MKSVAITFVVVTAGCTDLPDHDDPREAEVQNVSCSNLLVNGSFDTVPTGWMSSTSGILVDERELADGSAARSGFTLRFVATTNAALNTNFLVDTLELVPVSCP